MLNQEDLKWIASTSTELNSMLQQISRYSDLARQHKGDFNYIEMLGERVELASKAAQSLFDRVTSTILESTNAKGKLSRKSPQPQFSVVPAPADLPGDTLSNVKAPASSELPLEASADEVQYQILNPEGKLELILLVDDDEEILTIASHILTYEGYKVVAAKNGFDALKIYGHLGGKIRLVILDFFLPVMDGDAIFDELRALNPRIDVVLSSGFAEQSKLNAMLAQGLRGFIPKPYTSEKLLEQVRSTLDAGKHLVH
ncbi:MAG TPA: response regulator [Pyrinomonadaceae bacterium]